MMKKNILQEIDRRIKRLQAEIEIAETSMERISNRRYPGVKEYSTLYAVLMLAWVITGFLLLAVLSRKIPNGMKIPIKLYAIVLVLLSLPVLYVLVRKGEKSEPGADLAERARMARLLIREFYGPLRKAVDEEDTGALETLAERLLNDSRLAGAMEALNEGDPKLVAYALLLYSKFNPELRGEVENTVESLTNKPVKALLQSLLEPKGYNDEERSIEGEDHEV